MKQKQYESTKAPIYPLGHSDKELDRLIHQAGFWGVLTEQVFRLAGIKPGMRVLDVGCGTGDVSFLAARLVGSEGSVTGVDKSPEAIEVASQRAQTVGLTNVQFLTQDLSELDLHTSYDALVGRLVLMYFSDPAVVLCRLVKFLKPDGLVVFHEIDTSSAKSIPTCELFETSIGRIRQTLARAGADITIGLKLSQVFQEAGLSRPQMIQGARVETGASSDAYTVITQLTHTLLPLMERVGVASAAEVDVDTLAERLQEEVIALNATLVLPPLIGAWVQKGV